MRYAMPMAPTILARPRSGSLERLRVQLAVTEQVSGNIRRQLALERLNAQFLATVANISIGRARHLYNGRRSPTVSELSALANALGVPVTEFFKEG